MYTFDINKREDFLKGRTITYLAKEIGIGKQYLCEVLLQKHKIKKPLAYIMTKMSDAEKEIEDYFIKIV